MVDFTMKWGLRALAAFSTLTTLVLIAMTLFDLAIDDVQRTTIGLAIFFAFLAVALWHWSGSAGHSGDERKERHESIAQEATPASGLS